MLFRSERLAIALAQDAPRLADLRARLAEARNRSALFDTARFARNIEAVYEKILADRISE